MGALISFLVLIGDIYAIIKIFQSSAEAIKKAIWIAVVLVFPVVGLIVWYLAGPGGNKK